MCAQTGKIDEIEGQNTIAGLTWLSCGNLCSSCAFIAGLTDTQRTDNGLMEARCVLRGRGHGDPVRPRVQTQGRAAGTCAQRNVANPGIPTGSRLPSECATSTRSGACPIRRRGRPSSHPRGHERAGRTRAESPQRTASRAGAGAWQGSGSGSGRTPRAGTKQQRLALSLNRGDTGGIYQNACLFYGVRRLSCPLWVAAVECAEVSPCTTIGHHRFVFIRPWPSQACFQAVISRKLGPNDSALSVLSPRE